MRAIVLTGNQGNQKALCHRLARVTDIAGIVVSDNVPRKPPTFARRIASFRNRIANRMSGKRLVDAWRELLSGYEREFPEFPDVPVIRVRNVNDPETLDAIESFGAELTIVSGTNLVGRKVIESSDRIVNLHTGISPYVKGGPNCTNWCLAKGWFHLIGNTVMWLDIGIDTGKIIATEQTPLTGKETLSELHGNVMDHAHDLYSRCVDRLVRRLPVNAVPQDSIDPGKLFYNADWNFTEMRNAIRNFDMGYESHFADAEARRKLTSEIFLVPTDTVIDR